MLRSPPAKNRIEGGSPWNWFVPRYPISARTIPRVLRARGKIALSEVNARKKLAEELDAYARLFLDPYNSWKLRLDEQGKVDDAKFHLTQ